MARITRQVTVDNLCDVIIKSAVEPDYFGTHEQKNAALARSLAQDETLDVRLSADQSCVYVRNAVAGARVIAVVE